MSFVVYKRVSLPVLRWLFLLMMITTLNACSWFAGEDAQTGDARLLAPLEVPPDLVTPVGDPRLARPVLPELSGSSIKPTEQTVDCQCNEPPRIGERILPAGKGVQRMREGQRRWLVVEAEPEQVWPLVRRFLDIRGYRVQRDEPAIGLLETDWKSQYPDESASDGQVNWRESLRIRIEPAEKLGYTDIFLTQRNSQRVVGEDEQASRWELRPADEGRAVEMLNRLARYLAAEDVSDAVPLQPLEARIDVDSDQEGTVIIVKAGFDLTWRRTGLALDALGFTIEDHDRSSRIFHVYNELPSGLSEEELRFGKKKSATVREEYWIHVREKGESTHVSVRNQAGAIDESQITRNLLVQLLGQLE